MDRDERFPLAQQTILGSMLIDSDCVGDVLTSLTPEDFDEGPLRETFEAVQRLFNSGRPVDGVTVVAEMGEENNPQYRSFITQLMEITPTSANVMEYTAIVKATGMVLKQARN